VLLEPVEARLPLSLLLADPIDQLLHALGVQAAWSPLTVDPLSDQPAAPEDADVSGDGLVCQVEWLGELANRRLAPGEPADDRPTGTVTEGSEGGIQVGADVGSGCHGRRPYLQRNPCASIALNERARLQSAVFGDDVTSLVRLLRCRCSPAES
jgi:hypothetical protein